MSSAEHRFREASQHIMHMGIDTDTSYVFDVIEDIYTASELSQQQAMTMIAKLLDLSVAFRQEL